LRRPVIIGRDEISKSPRFHLENVASLRCDMTRFARTLGLAFKRV
jgi:hypothetical protein